MNCSPKIRVKTNPLDAPTDVKVTSTCNDVNVYVDVTPQTVTIPATSVPAELSEATIQTSGTTIAQSNLAVGTTTGTLQQLFAGLSFNAVDSTTAPVSGTIPSLTLSPTTAAVSASGTGNLTNPAFTLASGVTFYPTFNLSGAPSDATSQAVQSLLNSLNQSASSFVGTMSINTTSLTPPNNPYPPVTFNFSSTTFTIDPINFNLPNFTSSAQTLPTPSGLNATVDTTSETIPAINLPNLQINGGNAVPVPAESADLPAQEVTLEIPAQTIQLPAFTINTDISKSTCNCDRCFIANDKDRVYGNYTREVRRR